QKERVDVISNGFTRCLHKVLKVNDYLLSVMSFGNMRFECGSPVASAVLAEQGYKKGEVQIEGIRNDTFEQASSGTTAARGHVRGLRDFVRGLHVTAKTKEAQKMLTAITAEIDRIHPAPEKNA
ncbi:hypothetical protein ACLIIZ_20800, partial [Azonexus caeni]|uniref:hypothetical protein n=1 Tax=Azonexus caeni TaxID=266126 RepID=UPI003A876D13